VEYIDAGSSSQDVAEYQVEHFALFPHVTFDAMQLSIDVASVNE